MKNPEWTTTYTLDEAAECLPYHETLRVLLGHEKGTQEGHRLYGILWELLEGTDEETRAPKGGDGSEGTVETPAERLEEIMGGSSDCLANHWDRLEDLHQRALDEAWRKEWGE